MVGIRTSRRARAGRRRDRADGTRPATSSITAGQFDILVELVCADRRQLLDLTNRIRELDGVVSTESFLYLELWKQLYDWGARVENGARVGVQLSGGRRARRAARGVPAVGHGRRPPRARDQALRRRHRRRRPLARDRARQLLRAARPVGLRQDDDAADDRRLRGADRGDDLPRRRAGHRQAAVQARRQHRLPVVRALPAPDDLRERRLRPAPPRGARQGDVARPGRPRSSSWSASPGSSKRKPRQLSGGQQQRVALARALVNQPARAAARRAARRARPQAPQADAARAEGDPARHRHHLRPRHARPGRGDDDGGPDRDHERRPDRAARRAVRALREAARRRSSRASSASRTCSPGTVTGPGSVRLDDGTDVRVPRDDR